MQTASQGMISAVAALCTLFALIQCTALDQINKQCTECLYHS